MTSHSVALGGFALYSAFAPHSIAGAEIALAIAAAGWLVRTIATGKIGLKHTRLDLPILLFFLWTVLSSLFSEEPGISIPKLQSVLVLFAFYLTQAIVTRGSAVLLVVLMILSGIAGTFYSVYDLVRGRGVVVTALATESPFHEAQLVAGDAIWRVAKKRIYSSAAIDEIIRKSPAGTRLSLSVISQGEHVERPGILVTDELKNRASPSGITGTERTHRFRASGWTRHYQTFSEILQIVALLALGLAIANFRNHGNNLRFRVATLAVVTLAAGIVLTSMRSVLVSFALGAMVVSLRAMRARRQHVAVVAIAIILGAGATMVWMTRAQDALLLQDHSANLRLQLVNAGIDRVFIHPVFGHGMDSIKVNWTEWGFPGSDVVHLHSTPLQLAFERGLPALIFWLWIVASFWLISMRSEASASETADTNRYGVLMGGTGALAAFFASSLVNYNFGDGEVALVFWWLMGIVVVIGKIEHRWRT